MLTINLFNHLNAQDEPHGTYNDAISLEDLRQYEYEAALEEELNRRLRVRALKEQQHRRNMEAKRQRDLFVAQMYQQDIENRRRQQQQKRRMYEEEMEQRRQMHIQAEALERAKQQRRIDFLSLHKANEMKRRQMEEENRQKLAAQQRNRTRSTDSYHIIQGPGGQLYAINGDVYNGAEQPEDNEIKRFGFPANVNSYPFPSSSKPNKEEKVNQKERRIPISFTKEYRKPSKPTRKKVAKTIKEESISYGEVEDASDSECDNKFSSYFHNRRPTTPGEWIEPVEGIESMKLF